eukprot:scaffold104707_cov33-Tisochrysis_lutea.AAC.2
MLPSKCASSTDALSVEDSAHNKAMMAVCRTRAFFCRGLRTEVPRSRPAHSLEIRLILDRRVMT